MVHLVYCDDKEKVFEKILDGSKTMIIRMAAGKKILIAEVLKVIRCKLTECLK